MCLGVFLIVFILSRTLVLPGLGYLFAYPMLWKFSAIIPLNIFSGPFSLFSLWGPYNVNVGECNVPEVSGCLYLLFFGLFFLLILFFYIMLCGSGSHHSVFQVAYSFFCLSDSAIESF